MDATMKRRTFMLSSVFAVIASRVPAQDAGFKVTRSEAEWHTILSNLEYQVMREESTGTSGSSPLDKETRSGTFHCKGCDLSVYTSAHKYDSGTGWPSFWQSLPNAIHTKPDNTLFTTRTEVHCRRCGNHFGHIFDDGPDSTGKRHCQNGVSLTFKTA